MPTLNNDIKQEVEKFNQHIQLKDNVPNWFVLQLKTLQSKNITLEDWNRTVTYLQSTVSDNNSTQEFLNVLVDNIPSWDAIDVYTKEEIDTKLSGKANSVHSHSVSDITDLKKGQANGVASLGSDGRVPSSQLPSYVDDVLEFTNQASFPQKGEDGKIYIAKDTNKQYRWSGTAYVEISSSLALGETASTAYAGNKGKQNADNIAALQSGKADKSHRHVASDITDLQTILNTKLDKQVGTSQILNSANEIRLVSGEQVVQLNNGSTKYAQLSSGEFLLRITANNKAVVGNGVVNHELLNESMALTEEELNAILV